MAAKKVCDCAKSSRLPLNFLMNSGWGYLPLPSLEISAKSQQGIFCYEPKQDFSDNSDFEKFVIAQNLAVSPSIF